MGYYPSPYNNMYTPNYGMQNYSVPQYSPPVVSQPQNQYSSIVGKIVESPEIVKISEIPLGGYGVFPLSDYSKVIIKSYDKDGNLQYLNYDLVKPAEVKAVNIYEDKLNDIYDYIAKLDKKMDGIVPSSTPTTKRRKMEVEDE